MTESTHYDVLIVGGGLAGTSLACALDKTGIKTALVESVAMEAEIQPSFDDRAIALAWGSKRIFDGMGLWNAISRSATPIQPPQLRAYLTSLL